MRWPWQRSEKRSGYSDALLSIIAGRATGTAADALATAGAEMAAGALSRAFAGCRVVGSGRSRDALTGPVLGRVGRDLVLRGESLHVIDASGGRVRLLPASAWTVAGAADPRTWTFQADVAGPDSTETLRTSWDGVVLLQWSAHPARPHEGAGPLALAADTARLAAAAETHLGHELSGPVGSVVPVPGVDQGEDADPLAGITAALKDLDGGVFLAETTAAAWRGDRTEAPRGDWRPQRLGGSPPQASVLLRRDLLAHVLGACGTPVALFEPADGTAAREALRRYWIGSVIPLLRQLRAECARKLDDPDLRFEFDPYVLDLVGRAKTYGELRAAGLAEPEARRLAGLDAVGVVS